ncbi:hypothetical protein GJ496_007899 [Pomphorhynchus laevis]|nr:hypothetical protein GJ496_007899 [Pomphorhynchus laevis]
MGNGACLLESAGKLLSTSSGLVNMVLKDARVCDNKLKEHIGRLKQILMNANNITLQAPGEDAPKYEFDGLTNKYDIDVAHSDLCRRSHYGPFYQKQHSNGP